MIRVLIHRVKCSSSGQAVVQKYLYLITVNSLQSSTRQLHFHTHNNAYSSGANALSSVNNKHRQSNTHLYFHCKNSLFFFESRFMTHYSQYSLCQNSLLGDFVFYSMLVVQVFMHGNIFLLQYSHIIGSTRYQW